MEDPKVLAAALDDASYQEAADFCRALVAVSCVPRMSGLNFNSLLLPLEKPGLG